MSISFKTKGDLTEIQEEAGAIVRTLFRPAGVLPIEYVIWVGNETKGGRFNGMEA